MTNSNTRDTCRPLFNQLRILPLRSQYIYSLLLFVGTNKKLFLIKSQIHDINTRHDNNLHLPLTGLTLVQKLLHTLDAKFTTTYHSKLKLFRTMYPCLNLN